MKNHDKKRNFAFDPYGPAVFLLVMLPNIVWFLYPAPQDILRAASKTPLLDGAASFFQIIMLLTSCVTFGRKRPPLSKGSLAGIAASILLYFSAWGFYYAAVTAPPIVLTLCAAPCLAFLLLAAARKNVAAFCAAAIFAVCHTVSGLIHFVL